MCLLMTELSGQEMDILALLPFCISESFQAIPPKRVVIV